MTDLDRQIAEAKGHQGPIDIRFPSAEPRTWSTDIGKAFELVEELTLPANNRIGEFGFGLAGLSHESRNWEARFFYRGVPQGCAPKRLFAIGSTAPEAICQAYLEAVKYLKGRASR